MTNLLPLIIFFIIGTLMGSFYTVVGMRLPQDEKVLVGRSHCDHCGHKLSFLDMIPILSYICLRGKCRYCKEKIDSTSTFMELVSGILYLTAYYVFGPTYELFIALGIVSLLMIVIVSDINYLIIPDEVLIFMSVYFIVFDLLSIGPRETFRAIGGGIFLFALMYLIMLIGNMVFKKESLGGGDIKMMFIFGLILGPLLGCVSIFLGSFLALPVSLYLLYKDKEKVIPFGPFLLIALTLLYFTNITPELIISLIKGY